MTGEEVIPSARRLMRSLRGLGYSFPAAVADLVDNSIAARARQVCVNVRADGMRSRVVIADNGEGIPADEMREVMRYGTEREYDESDLGKFGLGLKTASMSQCRRLEVFSRTSRDRAVLHGYAWDLNRVEKTNRWEIVRIPADKMDSEAQDLLRSSPGTVVVWRQLDRVAGFDNPHGKRAENALIALCRELEIHLAMVFHRFIGGDEKRRVNLQLNGNRLDAWDPFARNERATKQLAPITISLDGGEVLLEPFVLPPQAEFSLQSAFDRASGPAKWNQQQGFYIYRAGRMIQSGGWCRLRAPDEHTKLARIALRFSPSLDDAFTINVSKMRVSLPKEIRDKIDEAVRPAVSIARNTYDKDRRRGRKKTAAASSSAKKTGGGDSPSRPRTESAEFTRVGHPRRWTLDELEAALMRAARNDEIPALERVLRRVRKQMGKE